MASTFSTNLKIELIGTGEQVGTWGTTTNTNLGTALEQAIVGRVTVTFATDANKTLTLTDSPAAQDARALFLNVTSGVSLTVTRDLIVPAINKNYIVKNATTGSQSIRVIVAGVGVTIPNGKTVLIYNDGTDVGYQFDYINDLTVATLTGTTLTAGALTVNGASALNGNTAVTGTLSATGDGTFSGTGQVKLPAGTTAQRSGSPANGMVRYNTSLNSFEGYGNGLWGGIGGAQAGGAIMTNKSTASVSYTIASGENGLSVGPVTIDSGVTITVATDQRWLIL
jgi:hypothetical protein